MQAQLFVYLLAVLSRCALNIVSVSPTYKPQTLTAMSRLEKVLSRNLFNRRVDLVPMDGLKSVIREHVLSDIEEIYAA